MDLFLQWWPVGKLARARACVGLRGVTCVMGWCSPVLRAFTIVSLMICDAIRTASACCDLH